MPASFLIDFSEFLFGNQNKSQTISNAKKHWNKTFDSY